MAKKDTNQSDDLVAKIKGHSKISELQGRVPVPGSETILRLSWRAEGDHNLLDISRFS